MLDMIRTDRGVIRKVLRGNSDAFRLLVDRYGGMVYGIACAHVGNAVDAEDITQETFVRLYQWLDRLSSEKSVGAWLVQVARSVAIDWLRKRGRETARLTEVIAAAPSLPNPVRDELHRTIWDQLATLDAEQREILVLYYFRSKRRREIARLLGISSEAAAKRIQRARDELGRRLIDALGDDWSAQKRDASRANRVMAAIATTAIPWKPSAAAAVAASAITGASATKGLLIVAATMVVVFAALFVGLKLWFPGLHLLPRRIQTTSQYINNSQPAHVDASTATASDAAKASVEPAPAPKPDAAAADHGPGRPVSGIVVTEQRQPVPGAKVTVDNIVNIKWFADERKNDVTIAPLTPLQISTVTGQDGTFSLASYPFMLERRYERVGIYAEAGDLRGSTSFFCVPDLADEYIQITVRPCMTLAGIVTDTAGVPLGNASVMLNGKRGAAVGVSPCWAEPDGTFLIKSVPRGEFRFMVRAQGCLGLLTDWFPSGKTDIVIKLERGNSISGRVTESATGMPVVDGCVAAFGGTENGSSRTDAEGKFTITGLTAGKVSVQFQTRDIPPSPYILPEPVVVDLAEGRPATDVAIKVFRGAILSGQMTDVASGAPLPGVLVTLAGKPTLADPKGILQVVKSDPDGHYEAPGLPPGDLELVAQAKDYAEKSMKVVVGNYGQTQRLDVRMEWMPAVNGTVVDSTGAPVAGASIVAIYATDNTEPWPDPAISDAAGSFRLSLPRTGPCACKRGARAESAR